VKRHDEEEQGMRGGEIYLLTPRETVRIDKPHRPFVMSAPESCPHYRPLWRTGLLLQEFHDIFYSSKGKLLTISSECSERTDKLINAIQFILTIQTPRARDGAFNKHPLKKAIG